MPAFRHKDEGAGNYPALRSIVVQNPSLTLETGEKTARAKPRAHGADQAAGALCPNHGPAICCAGNLQTVFLGFAQPFHEPPSLFGGVETQLRRTNNQSIAKGELMPEAAGGKVNMGYFVSLEGPQEEGAECA